ncbi:hypothetical protein DOTSEDRAFT_71374 [Dothistroma septosporum NZE10]|uniref:Uncharacterized protein n=1 Tax=Dothistroma septosporum (strain NZE10 / CBS 128990) TaxID=675120 RepID=N1PTC1_DOTSN|nr:hypothetical protein DOTSEDRAFT_71374 [Dothistroma septosporum NZE10]
MSTTSRIGLQPVYRRPSWAHTESSYKHYMRRDLAADRSPGADHGLDTFSYDEDHLHEWKMPTKLHERLPDNLKSQVTEWECAGAAVCTSLERIQRLDDDAIYRAYPEKTSRLASLSRPGSIQGSAGPGAKTPPMSSPIPPIPEMPSALLPLDKMSFDTLPQRRHIVGMESPPFTPLDSHACPTPDYASSDNNMPPDAQVLTRQLSPISMRSRAESSSTWADSSTSGPAVFDENAWETYLGTFNAELEDLRKYCWARFRGCSHKIDQIRTELSYDKADHGPTEEFNEWWAESKQKMTEFDKKQRELEAPTIELVRMERMSQGLAV